MWLYIDNPQQFKLVLVTSEDLYRQVALTSRMRSLSWTDHIKNGKLSGRVSGSISLRPSSDYHSLDPVTSMEPVTLFVRYRTGGRYGHPAATFERRACEQNSGVFDG